VLYALTVLLMTTANAHHSMVAFDSHHVITVTGTVTKVEWANPHAYLYVTQSVTSGEPKFWTIQAESPSLLRRQNWSKDSLHIGDIVTVIAYPNKDPAVTTIYLKTLTRGTETLWDDRTFLADLTHAGFSPAIRAKGFTGTWVTLLNQSLIGQIVTPNPATLTPAGVTALKHLTEEEKAATRCIPEVAPVSMIDPDIKHLTYDGNELHIASESAYGAERIIHLDESSHDGAQPSILGHSYGWWEGKTLVIDTAKFAFHREGNGVGVPSGTDKHLVERLTLMDDAGTIHYHFELSDPEFLAAPIKGDVQWVYRPNIAFAPVACDLRVARRFLQAVPKSQAMPATH
jgi:hypothetical protein